MLLVPRQLQRAGMTGNVPYYGGRFTPAQAYAASHSRSRPPHATLAVRPAPPRSPTDALEALERLLDTGVITPTEYQELRDRAERC
jgi:hypothetical protein